VCCQRLQHAPGSPILGESAGGRPGGIGERVCACEYARACAWWHQTLGGIVWFGLSVKLLSEAGFLRAFLLIGAGGAGVVIGFLLIRAMREGPGAIVLDQDGLRCRLGRVRRRDVAGLERVGKDKLGYALILRPGFTTEAPRRVGHALGPFRNDP
jgi:hypothetical protein